MGFRLAILAALASQIHAVSKDKVAISSNDQQGTEPEYLPETLKPKAQASETEDPRSILHTRDHLEDVKEYVEEKDLQSLIQTGMSSFLEISSQVHTVGASKPSDAAFFDAVISDDLEGEMERTKPGEKYVVRHMSQHNKQVVRPQKVVSQQQPEEPPKNLPKELHAVFQQMADKYEKKFSAPFLQCDSKRRGIVRGRICVDRSPRALVRVQAYHSPGAADSPTGLGEHFVFGWHLVLPTKPDDDVGIAR